MKTISIIFIGIIVMLIIGASLMLVYDIKPQQKINQIKNDVVYKKTAQAINIPLSNSQEQYLDDYEITQTGDERFFDVIQSRKEFRDGSYNISFEFIFNEQKKLDILNEEMNEIAKDPVQANNLTKALEYIAKLDYVPETEYRIYKDESQSKEEIVSAELIKSDSESKEVIYEKGDILKYTYELNPQIDRYLKFGDNSIIITQKTTTLNADYKINVSSSAKNISYLNVDMDTSPYNNLVVYYSFDADADNKTAIDWSSNSINANYRGLSFNLNDNCLINYCYYSDGTSGGNSRVEIPRTKILNSTINITGNFTITAWFYSPNETSGKTSQLFGFGATNANIGGTALSIRVDGTADESLLDIETSIGNSSTAIQSRSMSNIQRQRWNFISYVYSANSTSSRLSGGEINLSINGIEAIGTNGATIVANSYLNSIGADNAASPTREFTGSIDEVMIFNKSLTPAEVLAIYNNQSQRFKDYGTLESININLNASDNRVNVSFDNFQTLHGTNLSVRIGYWDLTKGYNDTYDGLVLYMKFDNNSADGENTTYVKDYSPFNWNFTTVGSKPRLFGKYNNSRYFNGATTEYLRLSGNLTLNSYPISASMWVWAINESLPETAKGFLFMGNSASANQYLASAVGSTGYIGTQGRNGGTAQIANSNLIINEEGTHVVSIWRNNTYREIYINGISMGISATSIALPPINTIGIGRLLDSTASDQMNGTIDELMVFNKELSQDEITELYNKGRAKYDYTPYQNISLNQNMTFTIDSTSSNIIPSYLFSSGETKFYTPLLGGNFNLLTWFASETPPAGDSCTYSSGNWLVACSDNCSITSNINLNNNNLTINSTGRFTVKANISNIDYINKESLMCEIEVYPSGSIT